jgi:hypothetical protein
MPFWVKVENEVVTQCWDTPPPAGDPAWRDAVEVRPAIVLGRQRYGQHSFDLTSDPVGIVWPVEEVSVEERKPGMIQQARQAPIALMSKMVDLVAAGGQADMSIVQFAQGQAEATVAAIKAANTHEELDALV